MKTQSIIRQLVTRIRVGSTALLGRVSAFCADPFRVERDWADFAKMTDAERKAEYNRLLEEAPRSDRFRRLNQHIASRWVYMPNAKSEPPATNHARAEEIIREHEAAIARHHEKIEKLTVALKDAISTYDPDRDVTFVTAERQEAWNAALL